MSTVKLDGFLLLLIYYYYYYYYFSPLIEEAGVARWQERPAVYIKKQAREDRTNGRMTGQQAAGPFILQLSAGDEEATERRAHKSREIRVGSDRTVPICNGEICDCYLFNHNGGFFFFVSLFLSLLLLAFSFLFLLFF